MYGDLLRANRSVVFPVSRVTGREFLFSAGATNVVNSNVADNNNAIPADRFGFRYNYFHNAGTVQGLNPVPGKFDPVFFGIIDTSVGRTFNTDTYTFDLEKTFFNGLASVQVRLPIVHSLSSDLNLNYGTVTGLTPGLDFNGNQLFYDPANPFILSKENVPGAAAAAGLQPLQVLNVQRTPEQTFGHQSTEFGDMDLIFKGLLYQDRGFAVAGGVSVHIPTARDTNITVVDYTGPLILNNAEEQRIRQFHIANQTWALTPFLAAQVTPTDRLFAQGFASFEIPLNSSRIDFTETFGILRPGLTPLSFQQGAANGTLAVPPGALVPPFAFRDHINEQALMHLDFGMGYWLYRNCESSFLTGVAPMIELHYTTTLNNAQIRTLPADYSFFAAKLPSGGFDPNIVNAVGAFAPQVGNQANRVDLLDLTVGTTVEIARQAQVGVAASFPLHGGDNRTFDWELEVQVNFLLGGPRAITPYSYGY
jgi:hypothetical protein